MNKNDLARVKSEICEAIIILGDKNTGEDDKEDANNIMRVISIKDYCPSTRVII